MSAQHTQGRLTFKSANDGQGDCGILAGRAEDGTGPVVIAETFADIRHAGEGAAVEAAANARRLVACWNACEGITTEELEHIASTGGMMGPREDVARSAAQRDELLAALEVAEGSVGDMKALEIVRAAIAKVKGGAA